MKQPIIGITPDRSDVAGNIEAQYFVRRNYCAAVAGGGAVPLVLPYQPELVTRYLDLIDGLVITGGMFDIDPARYGMPAHFPETSLLKDDRTNFEQAMLRGALARDLPVLGICGGMQLIAVELGARLVQHIPSEIAGCAEHKQRAPCDAASHRISVQPGSLLRRIVGGGEGTVNSLHHQAVQAGGGLLCVVACAEDGVAEAVEVDGQSFCLGVQWHPEYLINGWERKLFAALAWAARGVPQEMPI